MAAEAGCTHKTVLRYLRRFGITIRRPGQRPPAYPELRSATFLEARCQAGATASDIAVEVGCSRSAAAAALRAVRIPPREASPYSGQLTEPFLAVAYVAEGRSTVKIAAEVGCGASTVARYLRRYGIPMRPPGPAG